MRTIFERKNELWPLSFPTRQRLDGAATGRAPLDKRLRSTFFPPTLKYAFYVSSYPSWAMGVLSGLSDLTLVPQIFWAYQELNGHIWFTPTLTRQTSLPVSFVNSFLVNNPFLLMFVVQSKYRLGDILWYSWMGERCQKAVKGCQRLSCLIFIKRVGGRWTSCFQTFYSHLNFFKLSYWITGLVS